MIIDLNELHDHGFAYDFSEGIINIFPNGCERTGELVKTIKRVGYIMGFNEREVEELFEATDKIQTMSVLRKISR